jgi:hypothetical protein
MAGGLAFIGLAAAGAVATFLLAARKRRGGGLPARAEVPLTTLRAVVSGMEIAATSMARGVSVECFGDYRRDPALLVVEVRTVTEADADRLIAEGDLPARLREILRDNAYPAAAIPQVGLTIRSRERLKREAAALQDQEDLARWADSHD